MAAADPLLALADRAQHGSDAGGRVLRFRQRARDLVLQPQQLIALYAPGDVPADAAISLEAPIRVEDRLAAHVHISQRAVLHVPAENEIAKRLVALELRAVRGPVAIERREIRRLPARLAQ